VGDRRLPGGGRACDDDQEGEVRFGHLARGLRLSDDVEVDEPIDREDVQTIMESLMRAPWKLDLVLRDLTGGFREEEEDRAPTRLLGGQR
jgi:hypothetical protein